MTVFHIYTHHFSKCCDIFENDRVQNMEREGSSFVYLWWFKSRLWAFDISVNISSDLLYLAWTDKIIIEEKLFWTSYTVSNFRRICQEITNTSQTLIFSKTLFTMRIKAFLGLLLWDLDQRWKVSKRYLSPTRNRHISFFSQVCFASCEIIFLFSIRFSLSTLQEGSKFCSVQVPYDKSRRRNSSVWSASKHLLRSLLSTVPTNWLAELYMERKFTFLAQNTFRAIS